jgi:hypothetical protein
VEHIASETFRKPSVDPLGLDVQAVGKVCQPGNDVADSAQGLGSMDYCTVTEEKHVEIGGLNVQREVAIYTQLGRTNPIGQRRNQFGWPPISNFKVAGLTESSTKLMVEATDAEYVRHLDESSCPRTKDSPNLRKSRQRVFFGKMLQHTVGKYLAETFVAKGQESAIRHKIKSLNPQLLRDAIRCPDTL